MAAAILRTIRDEKGCPCRSFHRCVPLGWNPAEWETNEPTSRAKPILNGDMGRGSLCGMLGMLRFAQPTNTSIYGAVVMAEEWVGEGRLPSIS